MPPRLPRASPLLHLRPTIPAPTPTTTRTFIPLPSQQQQFTATRTLLYPPRKLYTLISDIDSYHKFLPYCLDSRVITPQTATTPSLADLRVGFGSYDETFRSEVTCDEREMTVVADGAKGGGGLFEVLVARWKVVDAKRRAEETERSEVTLRIDYRFANPLYGALSSAVIPKVAEVLVEAFERRAEEVLGKGRVGV
ncbi:hypothetical protein EX30DRAFT_392153 [Ascodesmis nigricans]|uniref:Coenzyme Q-binding protein COQ10 START domain-containing protein n=1 Tax=Ascodesmis nigricans TaxID=341454 RepID=A0A4S2N6B2_9PEZI|nr:hypothetical protein EX30DRAFT_392153 [Ascodesmis nigricans]